MGVQHKQLWARRSPPPCGRGLACCLVVHRGVFGFLSLILTTAGVAPILTVDYQVSLSVLLALVTVARRVIVSASAHSPVRHVQAVLKFEGRATESVMVRVVRASVRANHA